MCVISPHQLVPFSIVIGVSTWLLDESWGKTSSYPTTGDALEPRCRATEPFSSS